MLVLLSTSWFEVVVKTTVYPGWITLLVSLAGFFVLFSVEKSDNYSFFLIEVLSSRAFDQNFLHVLTFRSGIEAQFFLLTSLLFL